MFKALEDKTLQLIVKVTSFLANDHRDERGQTSAEYVAVTAVGVVIAISIIYAVLGQAINDAIGTISGNLTDFVNNPPVIS